MSVLILTVYQTNVLQKKKIHWYKIGTSNILKPFLFKEDLNNTKYNV